MVSFHIKFLGSLADGRVLITEFLTSPVADSVIPGKVHCLCRAGGAGRGGEGARLAAKGSSVSKSPAQTWYSCARKLALRFNESLHLGTSLLVQF